jgi:SAM-dependent methyltransferase
MTADSSDWSTPTLVEVNEAPGELPEPESESEPDSQSEPPEDAEPQLDLDVGPVAEVPAPPELAAEPESVPEPEFEADPEPELEFQTEPEPVLEPEREPEPEPEPEPELRTEPEPEPELPSEPEPAPDPARLIPAAPGSSRMPTARAPMSRPPTSRAPTSRAPMGRRPPTVYLTGSQPSFHDKLVQRVADIAVVAMPIPLRVLDIGCGDARLLSELILRIPNAELYVGLDPRHEAVPDGILDIEPRLSVVRAAAEALPLPNASFDLVLASMSLTLWPDQVAGAVEMARVVSDYGKVVVVEGRKPQLSGRNRVHGVKEITKLLESAGLRVDSVETVLRSAAQVPLAHAFIASP